MAQTAEKQRAAAYVPWGTFKNSLDTLAKNGMPNQINRSVFIGLAGGTQSQLVAAMKFLGLVSEDDDTPSDTLKELVKRDELGRKEILKDIFRSAYADLFALNLKKATPEEFLDKLSESYNVSGSTRRKAASFFLRGAEDIGIEVSPYLEKAKKVPKATRAKRRKKSRAKKERTTAAEAGTSKTVNLASGGTLTLSATLDLFSLSSEDRTFIFKLIDELERYEETLEDDESDEPEGNTEDQEEGGPQ